jgi:beta-xylosidase
MNIKSLSLFFVLVSSFPTTDLLAQNPYLPLWEHLPDGEPRVFEDPDNPGKYRAYIIGSHDVRFNSYCGPDIRMWSAPVEDLSSWRDEGAIFTYQIEGQWDVMYAPDLVEVKRKDGAKEYYLFPHSRGKNREAMVCKGRRPDGPFTPVNLTADGAKTLPGSILGFDPSVFVENITDPQDPDYEIGFRAYGYWGFQRSLAVQLDQNTMWSVRPGAEIIPYFMPAGDGYGKLRHPDVTAYPCIYPDENPGAFNFFEASSIRKVGNKYVTIYSGYSGPDYGIGSSNSALRYAYGDSPLGPWRSGGVLVDSRAPVPDKDGFNLQTSNAGHNTHGSIEQINGQWYVFYHRPPRGFGYARQAMVAPVRVEWDEKSVSEGGEVSIRAFDPYAKDNLWTAADTQGNEYKGAEVTSEGFHIFGLAPYQYYPAGIACYLSDVGLQQDSWDIWDNSAPLTNIKNGNIIGYKYVGFGGLDKSRLGLKAFEGTKKGNKTAFDLFLTPKTTKAFNVNIWLDGPWENDTWQGTKIGEIIVPANSVQEMTQFTIDVSKSVDHLDKKHAIFLVAEGNASEPLFDLIGFGFSSKDKKISRPVPPAVKIAVNGKEILLPATPVRSTNKNGIVGYDIYEVTCEIPSGTTAIPVVSATANNPEVAVSVMQASSMRGKATVKFDYNGVVKTYKVLFVPTTTNAQNPVIFADVPDMSMIRVGDTYYMSSTTMHMNPGVPIMKSKDLVNWEIVNYAYQTLADIDETNLANGKNTYGGGSWASCIRYRNGTYYVSTFAQTTGKTYIYTTKDIEKGPWTEHSFRPSLHDHTLFFDDDDKIYMIYGNGRLNIVELKDDLSGTIPGTDRVLIENASAPAGTNIMLGAEGSQLFKVNGNYYLFNITWPRGGMRTVVVHRADKITGPYEGKLVFQDLGVAQGGIVDTPNGLWYAYLFRDYGSTGRIPYLVPMKWEDGWPVIGVNGKVPETLDLPAPKGLMPGIVASDDFSRKPEEPALPLVWQWNHNPDNNLWSVTQRKGYLRLTTGRIDNNFLSARNTLTQRTVGPICSGTTSLDVSGMKDGDIAGLSLLQKNYGLVGVKVNGKVKSIFMVNAGTGQALEQAVFPLSQKTVYFRIECDFRELKDTAWFYYSIDGKTWQPVGEPLKMTYTMPHFMGYRFGLFNYATKNTGGFADFDFFEYNMNINKRTLKIGHRSLETLKMYELGFVFTTNDLES